MTEIDERVVEMRFKNSNFEKNAKQTINTLDDLEKKMSFPNAKKNFQNLDKEVSKISFAPLEKSVEAVTLKISALQIAGITALQRIANQAMDTGERLVKSLSIDQVEAGFTKYEQKTTAVQTIVAATRKSVDEVNSALEKLNWFTDETSYNFTDMVDNIGKFTSAGVDLEDAMSAMIGIANEAAISGQNAASASRAMYNFAQAIGTGAVKLMDWKSIENANMATQEFKQTIIDTAVDLGTLTKAADGMYQVVGSKDKMVSVNNFNENLSEGWFTSDVLVESLKQYSDYAEKIYDLQQEMGLDSAAEAMAMYSSEIETLGERAFKAGQVSKTLTDAIDATKDAVSTQWMKTFEMIVGNLDQASELWTEFTSYLWEFFASDLVKMNDVLQPALGTDNYRVFIDTLKDAGVAEEEFNKVFSETAKKYGISIDSIVESEGSLENAIKKHGWSSLLTETLDNLANGAEVTGTKVVDLTDKIGEYQDIVNRVIRGDFLNGVTERTQALAEAGYEFSVIQPLVNKQLEKGSLTADDFKEVLGNLTEEELKNIGITQEQAEALKGMTKELAKPTGRELLIDSFRNALEGVNRILSVVKEAWSEIFPPKTAEEIYAIIEHFHEFSKNLVLDSEGADKLKRSLKGVFAALDIVKQIVFGLTRGGLTILGKLFGKTGLDVAGLSASLGDNIVALRDWLNEGNKIETVINSLVYSILHAKETVLGFFDSFRKSHPEFSKWFDGLIKSFDDFKKKVENKWDLIVESIKNGDIKYALEVIASDFLDFRDTVISYLTGINFREFEKQIQGDGFKGAISILDSFKATFIGLGDGIKKAATTVSSWIKTLVSSINPILIIPAMFIGALIVIDRMSKRLESIVKLLTRLTEPLTDIKNSIIGVLDSLKSGINKIASAKAFSERAKAIEHIAISIAILAGSCWLLAQVPWPQLVIGAGILVALGGALVIFNNGLKGQGKGLARLNQFATGLGIAVGLLAASFKILETVKPENAYRTVLMFISIFGMLSLSIVGLTFVKDLPQIKGTLISLAIVIGMISTSFIALNFVKTDGLLKKVLSIGLVLLELVGVVALMAAIQKKWKSAAKRTANSLIGVVVAIDLLVLSLKLIQTVKVRELLEHLGSFIAVFIMMNTLAKIAGKVSSGNGGWQILALAAGLLILTPAIKSLSKLEGKELAKATAAVGAILLLEALIVRASNKAGEHAVKAGAMILMISGAVAALALVVWGFSYINPADLAAGTLALDSLLGMLALIIYVSKEADANIKNVAIISAFAMALGVMVIVLASIDSKAGLEASAAISLLLLSVALTVKMLNSIEPLKKGVTTNLFALSGVAAVIAVILTVFEQIDPEKAIGQVTAISILLLALSGSVVVLQKFGDADNDLSKVWPTLIMMTVVMAAMAGVLALIKDIDASTSVEQIGALSLMMGSLLAATTILALISKIPYIDKIEKGMLAVGKVLGIVSLVLLTIGGLESTIHQIFGNDAVSLTTLLEEATLVMTALGNAIGSLVGGLLGGIVGGAGEAFMSHLPSMGDYLSQFADAIKPFLAIVGNVDSDVGQNVSLLTKSILDLTAAEFLTSVNDFLAFLNPVTAINKTKEIASGETPFDKLGKGLENYGQSISNIADIFAEIESRGAMDDLEKGVEISGTLTDLLKAIPSQSWIEEKIKGKVTWTNLSEGLEEYGKAINRYALQALALSTGTRITAIERSLPIAGMLTTIVENLPESGGWIDKIFGSQDWSSLSTGLASYGHALFSYAGWVAPINKKQWNAIKASVEPSKSLCELLKALNESNPLTFIEALFHKDKNDDWAGLSTGLSLLGNALTVYATQMSTFETSGAGFAAAERTVQFFENFVTAADRLIHMDGLGTIETELDNAAHKLGNGIGSFGDAFDEDDRTNIREGIRVTRQLTDVAKGIKDAGIAGGRYLIRLGEDVKGYATEMSNAAKTLKNITNEDFAAIAKYAIAGYVGGFQNGLGSIVNVTEEFTDTVKSTSQEGLQVRSPSRFFQWLAENCVSGYDNFFSKGNKKTKNTVQGFVDTVKSTAQDGLGVHSDSVFFGWLAENCNSGFAHSLENGYNQIKTTVSGWVSNITDSIDLDSITSMFSEFGLDLSSVLPDTSSLGLDFLGEDLTFSYEKQIADMKTNIKSLTEQFGASSDEVINANLQLDALTDEYKDYTKSREKGLENFADQEYSKAQKEFDKLLEDYKAGRKSQIEFDNEYTSILQKNTYKQAELFQYSAEKIQEYVTDSLSKVQEKFEDKISDIQSKMESTQESWNKTWDDEFKFTTNQDLFDEEISKYDENINHLNKEIEKQTRLHGEDSIVVQKLRKDLEQIQKTRDEINEQWEQTDEDYKNQIVSVDMTDEWDKQAERAKKSLEAVDSLKGRLSEDMIDWLGTLDPDKLYAVATDWATKSDSELEVIQNKWLNMTNANKALSESLYSPEIVAAEQQFLYDYNETLNKLPDTAKAIGASIVTNMVNSFSEETNKTLETFSQSGDVLVKVLQESLGLSAAKASPEIQNGLKEVYSDALGNSLYEAVDNIDYDGITKNVGSGLYEAVGNVDNVGNMKATGEVTAELIGEGFVSKQDALVQVYSDALGNSLYEAVGNVDFDGIAKSLGNGLYEALGNIDADTGFSVSSVVTNTNDTNKKSLNANRSVTVAGRTGFEINERRNNSSDKTNTPNDIVTKSFEFIQNITSPKALNRTEIRRDTRQILTLANSKFS